MNINPSYVIIGLLAIIVIIVLFIASKMKYCANPLSDAGREKEFRKQQKKYKKSMRQQMRNINKMDYDSYDPNQFMETQQMSPYYQRPNIAIQQRSTRCVYPIYVDNSDDEDDKKKMRNSQYH